MSRMRDKCSARVYNKIRKGKMNKFYFYTRYDDLLRDNVVYIKVVVNQSRVLLFCINSP